MKAVCLLFRRPARHFPESETLDYFHKERYIANANESPAPFAARRPHSNHLALPPAFAQRRSRLSPPWTNANGKSNGVTNDCAVGPAARHNHLFWQPAGADYQGNPGKYLSNEVTCFADIKTKKTNLISFGLARVPINVLS